MTKNKGAIFNQYLKQTDASHPPGIIASPEGFALSAHNLPASDHYFCATHFSTKTEDSTLHILFLQKSAWDPSKVARLALEIVFPIQWATKFLYDAVWNQPGINGVGKFIDIVKMSVKTTISCKDSSPQIPADPNCYRMLAANFGSSTISSGQGMLEFFEASPSLLVNLTYNMGGRPNDGVKPVVSVLAPVALLKEMFEEIRPVLSEAFDKEKNEKGKV